MEEEEKKDDFFSMTFSPEFPHGSRIELGIIQEKRLLPAGEFFLFTDDCPHETREELVNLVTVGGLEWLLSAPSNGSAASSSRRATYFPYSHFSSVEMPVFLQKNPKKQPGEESLKVKYFSESVLHEIRTSYLLQHVLSQVNTALPNEVQYKDQLYQLTCISQTPWGALIDTKKHSSSFTFFKKAHSYSLRNEVESVGGWNYVNEADRKLYSQFHALLGKVSEKCLDLGLEPWDLGVHQLMYRVDELGSLMEVCIIDTEEYNIPARFGQEWPTSPDSQNLFPVIFFL